MINMKNREQNLTQAGTILLLSSIIVKLIGALFKIPLSSDYALGDLGFGYFSAVYDLYTPIYTLALSGFPVAISKITADAITSGNSESQAKIHFSSLRLVSLIGVIVTFLFCGLAIPMVLTQSGDKNAFYCIIAIAPSVLICSIVSVYRGYFEGRKNMIFPAVSNVIEALGKLCLGLLAAIVTVKLTNNLALGAAAALFGITLGTVASLIYLKINFKRNNQFALVSADERKYDKNMRGKLLGVIIPVAVASLSMAVVGLIDSVTLRPLLESILQDENRFAEVLLKGTSYTNINIGEIPTLIYGIKSKAHTIFHLAPTFTMAFGIGAVPMVSQYFAQKDKANIKKNVEASLKFSSILAMPIAVGCFSLSFGIMSLLYGDASAELGGKILQIYSVASLFAGLTIPTTALLQGISRQREALVSICVGIAVKMILNFVLVSVPSLNVFGAVVASVCCFAVTFVLNMVFLIKGLGFVPNIFGTLLKPFIAAVACGLTAFLIANNSSSKVIILVAIVCAGVVYVGVLLALKAVTLEDGKELFKI